MKWIYIIFIFITTLLTILFGNVFSLWVIAENYTLWLNHLITETWQWIFVIATYALLIYLFFGIGVIPERYGEEGIHYKHCTNLYTQINQMNICLIFVCTILLTIFYDFGNNSYFYSVAFTQGLIAIIGATIIYQIYFEMSLLTIVCTSISMIVNIFMGITIWMIIMSWGVFGYIVAAIGGCILLGMTAALFSNRGNREESKPYLIAIPYLVLGGIGLHIFGIIGCAAGCFAGLLLGAKFYLASYNQSIPHCPRCGNELITTSTAYANDTLYIRKKCYRCGYITEERG
ncbi:MAG: hypothetical protein ACLTSL_18150 [Odoribacter splanchnicus]